MMNLFLFMGLAVFAAICAAYLKKKNQEISLVFSLAVIVLLLFGAFSSLTPLIDEISAFALTDEMYLTIPLKVLGLTLLGKFTCTICEDAGEKGISSAASLVTRIGSVLIAVPLFEKLLEEIRNVLI